jgi:hypothetical protein
MKQEKEINMKQGSAVNMKLFSITASIIALVAAGIVGSEFLQTDREGLAFWCGKIQGEERVQHETFHDYHAVPLPECKGLEQKAEAFANGEGTVAGTWEKVASFVLPRSWASTRE